MRRGGGGEVRKMGGGEMSCKRQGANLQETEDGKTSAPLSASPRLAQPNHRPPLRSRVGVPLLSGIRMRVALDSALEGRVRPADDGLGGEGGSAPWDVRGVIPLKSGTPTPVRTFCGGGTHLALLVLCNGQLAPPPPSATSADCQSAAQQIANLRYAVATRPAPPRLAQPSHPPHSNPGADLLQSRDTHRPAGVVQQTADAPANPHPGASHHNAICYRL